MNLLALFIRRPVATTLVLIAIALPGLLAFRALPISSLPQVDFPAVSVQVNLPGASPEAMAATVATPLERTLGRIAGITEMTSASSLGRTNVNLQFDLDKNPDTAAREVQSAINAARGLLPANLPTNPTYRKVNSGSSPVVTLTLSSDVHTQDQLYDVAFNVIGQKVSQLREVGQVGVNGSALRSVRVEVDPLELEHHGVSLDQVRRALAAANVNTPKGFVQTAEKRWQIDANDRAKRAADYRDLIVAFANGSPVRLSEVASVEDSIQEWRTGGSSAGRRAVIMPIQNQPGTNVVEMVDKIKALLPTLSPLIPAAMDLELALDRSTTIRASLREIEHTMLLSIALVILVTFAFLRSGRATLVPAIAIPVSLLGTLAVIYFCGYSLNNLSLRALIISTGFVVDDAIVVVENVTHHIEQGVPPFTAALRGVREVGFTVIAMSVSLIAVFIPLLFMGGVVGQLFREFAVTLAVAVAISMVVSLIGTPMLCSRLLTAHGGAPPSRFGRAWERALEAPARFYARTLGFSLRHGAWMLLSLFATAALSVYLYSVTPKGFFPIQDTGRLYGTFVGDQSVSFPAMRRKVEEFVRIVRADPAVDSWYEFSGGGPNVQTNSGNFGVRLKPLEERKVSATEVVNRLRPKLARVPGAQLLISANQDLNIGTRSLGPAFQYTLLSSDLDELRQVASRLHQASSRLPEIVDVSSDFQDKALESRLIVDRDHAARLGISASQIDATLSDAFAQRLVSTIYEPLNQYFVVLTLDAAHKRSPDALANIYVSRANGERVPLAAFSHWETKSVPLAVNHQGQFPAATISFNLAPGVSLDRATAAIQAAFERLNPPASVRGSFSGTAQVFRESLANQPWLVLAAVLTVYIVLGVLYESLIHPITILSTLPSAGVGALIALLLFKTEFTLIALIGVVLLVGIVMKNAIILIDCALQAEHAGMAPRAAIHHACLLRFRPILMTTLAAMLGALPLALEAGNGSELRRPLGIAIVGGLVVSQLLTLYTTPAVYLALERLRRLAVKPAELPRAEPAIAE